jgi:biotin synthase
LKDAKGGSFELALKVMAITRLILPDINIPATTAMETLNPNGRVIALQSGANVVMPNVTEGDYRRKYALYPGKICVNDAPSKCVNCITAKIHSIGRTISKEYGFRWRSHLL